jgi:hypothetical protein
VAIPPLHRAIHESHGSEEVDSLLLHFVATRTKRNWIAGRVIYAAKMLKWWLWRRLRLQGLEIRMLLFKSRILCLQRGYLRGDESELDFDIVLFGVVINHPFELFDVLKDAAHIVCKWVKRPNDNKMSDGGRERASLGVEVCNSSQQWGVQRSVVRSIALLVNQ